MSSLIQLLYDKELVVTILVAVAAFATIITVAMPYLERDKLSNRLKTVTTRREELRMKQREMFENQGQQKAQLRSTPVGFMKQVVEQFKLQDLMEAPEMKNKLARAGLRGQRPLITFMFIRMLLPIVLLFGAIFYLYFINDHGYKSGTRMALCFMAVLVGYYLPSMVIQNITQKRQASIMSAFPDSLDLLLICVESGMSIEAAFNRVANEIGAQSPELAEEFGLTTAELSYLPDRRMAYENFASRTGHVGVKAVCTTLIQSERYGTPVATGLRVMAQENRDMRMNLAEKKAAALPAKLTVPMIVFFLPVLFVVILGPAALRLM